MKSIQFKFLSGLVLGLTLLFSFQSTSFAQRGAAIEEGLQQQLSVFSARERFSLEPKASTINGLSRLLRSQDTDVRFGENFKRRITTDNKLTSEEQSIAREAYQILNSVEFQQIIEGHENNKATLIKINGRSISYDDAPFSGMTWFEENGFNVGREAFETDIELVKTVLHELHRLTTSKLRGSGNAADVSKETKAAFYFAEKAYYLFE